jgi:cytochrome c biogenesis protein CcmG, thiol:disulfide interchange protein DsbE
MRRLIPLIPIAVVAVLAALFVVGLGRDPKLIPSVLINQPAPQFSLKALPGRGDTGLSTADLKGQVTLVDIYGSWCIACVQEHPTLLAIKQKGEVVIQGIDWRDDPEQGAQWLKDKGDPYTRVGVDPAPGRTSVDFGVTGAPESFIVDSQGVIRYKYIGPITPAVWENILLPIIRGLRQ